MSDNTEEVRNGDASELEAAPPPLEKKFFNVRTLVSFCIAFAILFFVFRQMDLDVQDIVQNIRQANPWYYLLAMVVYYSAFIVRSLRWRLLLENVGFRESAGHKLPSMMGLAEIIFLSWFANCIMPAKLGDAYRAYLLKRNAGVSFSRTFGTILAERIIDLLLTFILLAITGYIAFRGILPPTIVTAMQASVALVVITIVGLLAMRHYGDLIRKLIPSKLRRYYSSFEEGTLGSFKQMPLVLAYSVLAWIIESSRLYLVILALGITGISFPIVLFTAIAGSLITSIPGTPAGLGVVESGIITILVLSSSLGLIQGVDSGMAASVAVLDRTISYWSLVLFGTVVYVVTKKK